MWENHVIAAQKEIESLTSSAFRSETPSKQTGSHKSKRIQQRVRQRHCWIIDD